VGSAGSLRGTADRVVSSKDAVGSMKHLLRRLFPRVRRRGIKAGRPVGSGRWSSREELEQAVQTAIEALEERGRKPTQENVARILFADPRTLRRWLAEHDLDWATLRRHSLSSKL